IISPFTNDKTCISTKWLLRQINGCGLPVQHLLQVIHLDTAAAHYLALLPDNLYVCDCCMGLNLGIPCRHYFQVLSMSPNMQFNLGII
ncbi:hypothetical protein ARMSODRAFT_876784, partial [Armillaria solidipes]